MYKIYITRNIENAPLVVNGPSLVVKHKTYPSVLLPNSKEIIFENKKDWGIPQSMLKQYKNIIFVGINKIVTPHNRWWPSFEALFNNTQAKQKYSIDYTPYIGDIWRLWFHFGLTDTQYSGYTYSYLLETHYNKFLDGIDQFNPMSLQEILKWAKDKVWIDYKEWFQEPKIKVHKISSEEKQKYEKLKGELFEKYEHKITNIIRELSKFGKIIYPNRFIPQINKIFESGFDLNFKITDLKVDIYLIEQIKAKVKEVNEVTRGLYDQLL